MDEIAAIAPKAARSGQPLRVCLIVGQLGLGGAEKQVVLLADGLRQRGVEVTVVVLTGDGPRGSALRLAGVPVVHIGLRQPGDWRAVPLLFTATLRLTGYLRRSRPHVIHAFLFHSYVLSAPAARLARVPVVIAGRRSLDDFKRGRRWVLAAERVATALTHHLVANADAVADCVRTTEQVPDRKLSVIYNGLPPAAFEPARPAPLVSRFPVILCVANLKSYKGHHDLVTAAGLLRDRGRPCTLALAGDGPEREALTALGERLNLDVRLLGIRTDIDELLARADVAVLSSVTEGMSNAVMEAMAAGRPVVATAVGGTPELLADGRGVLVPPGDPTALADALGALLADPGLAGRLAQTAQQWSRTHLSVDAMVHRHLALYETLLAR